MLNGEPPVKGGSSSVNLNEYREENQDEVQENVPYPCRRHGGGGPLLRPRLRRRGCGLRGGEYLDRRRDPD